MRSFDDRRTIDDIWCVSKFESFNLLTIDCRDNANKMATTNHTQQSQSVVYIIAIHNDRSLPRDEFMTIINSLKQSTHTKKKNKIFKSIHWVRVCHALHCTVLCRELRVCKKRRGTEPKGVLLYSLSSFSFFLFFHRNSKRSRRAFGHSPFWPAKLLLSLPILKRLPATNSESAAACYCFWPFFLSVSHSNKSVTQKSLEPVLSWRERESPPLPSWRISWRNQLDI